VPNHTFSVEVDGQVITQSASFTVTDQFATPPPGQALWYSVDFRQLSTLPAGWTARTGGTNAGHTFRAQNLQVVPDVGLIHILERPTTGGPVYSGAANGRIGVPQFCTIRFDAYVTRFRPGVWPSFWARPQAGGAMQGEKDYVEGFGGHIPPPSFPRVFGGGFIATSASPYNIGNDTVDYAIPKAGWETRHTYECRQVAGKADFYLDGTLRGTVNAAGMSTSAARTAWAAQFDNPAATWYLRTDFQSDGPSNTNSGNTGTFPVDLTGEISRWVVERVAIFV